MNYRNRKNSRNFKKVILNVYNILKFDNISLSFSSKITMIGNLILFVSLFMPWILKTDEKLSWNSFQAIGGYIGFISLLLILFISFIVIFLEKTEKLKLSFDISFKDYSLIILFGLFVISIGFIYVNFINGLSIFLENIITGQGVILFILSGFVISFGGYLKKRNYHNKNYESFVNETGNEKGEKNNKSNMKLPF